MAIMWFTKDGRRPHTQRGPGIDISAAEIQAIFGSERLHFAGLESPNINPDEPSHSVKNVILEIDEEDGFSDLLPQSGCYVVVGMRPRDAEAKLLAYRRAA